MLPPPPRLGGGGRASALRREPTARSRAQTTRTGTAPARRLYSCRLSKGLGGLHHDLDHLVDRPLDVRVLDHPHALAARTSDDVRLDASDVVEVLEVLLHRADPARRHVAHVEVDPVNVL